MNHKNGHATRMTIVREIRDEKGWPYDRIRTSARRSLPSVCGDIAFLAWNASSGSAQTPIDVAIDMNTALNDSASTPITIPVQ